MSINCKINKYLDEYNKLYPFSGAIVVVNKGEVIFNKNYGMPSIKQRSNNEKYRRGA